jgi:hypothetical protein
MNTAVCFSGLLRCFECNYEQLYENLLRFVPNPTLFFSIANNIDSWRFANRNRLNQGIVVDLQDDVEMEYDQLPHACGTFKMYRTYINQVRGYQLVNQLRRDTEIERGITYDLIIRCRPDIDFVGPIDFIDFEQVTDHIIVPKFHRWSGYNDRFAIGPRDLMDVYFNVIDDHPRQRQFDKLLHPERSLMRHLQFNNIPVKQDSRIKFRRIREIHLLHQEPTVEQLDDDDVDYNEGYKDDA